MWAVIDYQQSEDGNHHVVPLFGKKHRAAFYCWCKPHVDSVASNLIIHEVQQ